MKKALITLALMAAAIALPSCNKQQYSVSDNAVTITPVNGPKVRLQVLGDKIIRVSATPDNKFPVTESLAVVPQEPYTDFSVSDDNAAVIVTTPEIKATVSKTDGQVTFYDKDGNLYLSEQAGGRSFSPISVEATDGYTVSQVWDSPNDSEGIYGLGQHQSDEWNYKGKNEELYQYNTKVSVPMIVSTGNYGLLWDSYSLLRWGNPNDYLQLGEAFELTDKDGMPGALTGTYVAKDGTKLVRREENINFENLKRSDLAHVVNLPEDFDFNGAQVTYEGSITPKADGEHDFILYYSGYQTVNIDGKDVVPERWRTAWNPNNYKFSANLEKGKTVPIKIDWTPNGGVAYCGLRAYLPEEQDAKNDLRWWGEMQDMIDYYFIAGDNMDDVLHGYRTLTGKAQVMPRWAMGYWQSREKYNTRDEVLSTVAEYRKHNLPLDNIVIDWLHWPQDSWGSHEFDPERFPDPKGMVDSIHEMNAHVMVSVWPKFYVTTEHYKEFDEKGWMYRKAVEDSIRDWVGPGYLGSFYDAYNPDARKLFWHQMEEHYYPLGIDAWWMDASEPNIRDCVDIQYRKDLAGPTALGPSAKYFNAYALMNAEAIYDGQRGVDPDKRVFLLTRSGFAGQQRYSTATWSGDIATRWEDMKAQISAGLNFAMAGIPFWTMDIGGFCVEDRYVAAEAEFLNTGKENADLKEWRELNTRWFQFGAFAPLFRTHGQWPFREVYNIAPEGHPAYNSIAYYLNLRYRLMPYIYSLNGAVHHQDYTMMRPLVMDFTADANTYNVGDQFMFGNAFMAAPVYTYGARKRDVYFPAGADWYDFYSGRMIPGGQLLKQDAPYEHMPLYVRSGAIVPMGPVMQYADEKPADDITIYVYAGQDGKFTLYEDENINYNYEKGQFSTIDMVWNDGNQTLNIGNRNGEFPGMLQNRKFNVVKIDSDHPKGTEPIAIDYNGQGVSVKL